MLQIKSKKKNSPSTCGINARATVVNALAPPAATAILRLLMPRVIVVGHLGSSLLLRHIHIASNQPSVTHLSPQITSI